jgi:hypothetical protein
MIRYALAAALALTAVPAAADAPGPGYDAKPRAQKDPSAAGKSAAQPTPAKKQASGKPRAPVRVAAAVSAGSADLTLTFDAPAKNVTVKVHGTDGLQVTSGEEPIAKGEFAGGESAQGSVAFSAPEGQANLVVTVTGDFRGVRQSTVASFTVGRPSAAQQKEREQGVVDDGKGGKINLSPAQER